MNTNNVVAIASSSEPDETTLAQCSAERGELRKAIEMRWRARTELTAVEDAAERARAVVQVAAAEIEQATAAIEGAKARDAETMAAALRKPGAALSSAGATRKARAKAETAADDLDLARAALAQLEGEVVAAEEKSRRADLRVEVAINAVLAAEAAPSLVERLENLKAEIPALQAALYFIKLRGGEKLGTIFREIPALAAPISEIERRLMAAVEIGLFFNSDMARQHPATEAWAAAVAGLRAAADAPLPSMD